MTNDEAKELIVKATKRTKGGTFESSRISGGIALVMLPFALSPAIGGYCASLSGIFVVTSVVCYLFERGTAQGLKGSGVLEIWEIVTTPEFSAPHLPRATASLRRSISYFYQQDVNAQTFPLVQAMRLLDAHTSQQRRLEVVEYRLNELSSIRQVMRDKLAQLRALGEDVPEAQRKLDQIERDEAALENIAAQIEASCARLEAIFTGVQHAHQVRQLKRELGELSQVAGSATGSDLALDGDAFDIERQIGKEIETFIRLERETDEHLRDV